MTIKIAINGYGRIGRQVLRAIYEYDLTNQLDVVAVNASGDLATNAHLTKFDTVHGRFNADISHDDSNLIINGKKIPFFATRNPAELPWAELGVDLVLECTGAFTTKEKCQAHLNAGAKKVLISAPGGADVDATIVYGVNHNVLTSDMTVVSNASCTTNCLAPVAKALN
ncbi:MAG: aldehyde dehydrogenase, partial [Neisseriaceae bacterium]|nr:aldehyde dehydrogenase [Neisseriaceae bacterium]